MFHHSNQPSNLGGPTINLKDICESLTKHSQHESIVFTAAFQPDLIIRVTVITQSLDPSYYPSENEYIEDTQDLMDDLTTELCGFTEFPHRFYGNTEVLDYTSIEYDVDAEHIVISMLYKYQSAN